MRVLFDTNILIDYLNGIDQAQQELDKYQTSAISLVTWMEVLVGAADDDEMQVLRGFLSQFQIMPIDQEVAERAVTQRRLKRIRLPDALIGATAEVHNLLLVTRNTRDFSKDHPGIRVPYEI